jgi:hypothetical protein
VNTWDSMTWPSKASGYLTWAFLVLLTSCAPDRPLVEQFQQEEWQPRECRIVSLVGNRDGTRLSFSLRLEGERHLFVEGTLEIDPRPRLVSGRWQEENGSQIRSGPVSAAVIDFFGGQGGRPSLRGQLSLSLSDALLYRVNLPTRVLQEDGV